MSTQRQIEANRCNSQKFTGPTSPEGKAASSLNALKSGIHASSHVIRGEDPGELEALSAAFLLHQPVGPTQLALVDTLIAAEWTQRRLRRIEAQLWDYQLECLDKNLSQADWIDESIQHNSPLGHSYQNGLEAFTRLQRRIECPKETQSLTPQIGFVPAITPAPGARPHVDHENHKSSLEAVSLETQRRALQDHAPSPHRS